MRNMIHIPPLIYYFVFIWHSILVLCDSNNAFQDSIARSKIAVCVSGQMSRWIPETSVKYLLEYNPEYDFTFFYNLQYHTSNSTSVFSTDASISFQPTKFISMKQSEVFDYLHNLYIHLNNTKIASLTFVPSKQLEDWESFFQGQKPYAITQYSSTQHVILNFYSHQVRCIHQIEEYEKMTNTSFQYVLQTREDIYYFQGVSLRFLLSHLKDPESSQDRKDPLKCDFITKDCLQWGGINMRWQLMTKDASKTVMGKRIDYYRSLLKENQTTYNPEQYELQQLKYYKIRICEFLSNKIPNAVGRHVKDDEICLSLKPETIDNCIPTDNITFVQNHFCHKIPKHYRNKKFSNS